MNRHQPFDANWNVALLSFKADSSFFCEKISELAAQEYAVAFTRSLLAEAKGLQAKQPEIPRNLSEAKRKLIEIRLLRMYRDYFSKPSATGHRPE